MAVYVDDMAAPYGRLLMCHMVADTHEELLAMVAEIGVDPKWIQHAGRYNEHFDIARLKRTFAVRAGAIEVTQRELVYRTWLKSDDPERRARAERALRDAPQAAPSPPPAPSLFD